MMLIIGLSAALLDSQAFWTTGLIVRIVLVCIAISELNKMVKRLVYNYLFCRHKLFPI